MNNEVRIEVATENHYEQILGLFHEAFGSKFGYITEDMKLRKEFINDVKVINLAMKDTYFVALVDGKVAGFMSVLHQVHKQKDAHPSVSGSLLVKKFGWKSLYRAMVMSTLFSYKPKRDEVYLENIAVSSDYRGQGVGKQLIGFLEEFTLKHQKDVLSLQVIFENERAKSLYERIGFKVTKITKTPRLKSRMGVSGYYHMVKSMKG